MPPLPTSLRKDLEKAVIHAREAAEHAATASLQVLAVDSERAFDTMSQDQKAQRTALRARMRALAPTDTAHNGADQRPRGFRPLVEEVAYEQWHRMLFARFLAENDLLIHPEQGVSVSLEECAELAAAEGEPDEWTVAAKYASAMLPGIFRRDDPSAQVRFAADGRAALERILKALPAVLFQADDALGWVYQFWQTKAKDEVNKSGRKVGGKDLAPVTQLFTEHYMVRFLLENSLGAWWAGRHPESPLCKEWEYLRFRDDATPAAGTFDGWPATAAEVTIMDPCCGSGHFLVAAADMLRKMRMEEDGLTKADASWAVLRDNLFGLELDPRCTQIAVFALAFDAWKHGLKPSGAGGAPTLPNVACSGLSVGGQLSDWTKLAGDDTNLQLTLERLYELFKDAPDLGSLVNPNDLPMADRMFLRSYADVADLVAGALAKGPPDPGAAVFGLSIEGVAGAVGLLSRQYTLVATNPPYLSRSKQAERLRLFADTAHPDGKGDLATMFIERCRRFAAENGSYAMVTPQNWLFLSSSKQLRRTLLGQQRFCLLANLGPNAFRDMNWWAARTSLLIIHNRRPRDGAQIVGLDVSGPKDQLKKAELLKETLLDTLEQDALLGTADARVMLAEHSDLPLLESYAIAPQGIKTGDDEYFRQLFWEAASRRFPWRWYQSTMDIPTLFGGRQYVLRWGDGTGIARPQGLAAWGKQGICIGQMRELPAALYSGDAFDSNVSALVPRDPAHLGALWAFCSSEQYRTSVRSIDQGVKVANSSLVKVPFDLAYWQRVAADSYPRGLPEPHSDDPTQWLFKGNVMGSEAPLQVAVASLMGYRWPDHMADSLDQLTDRDGIVCLPALQGEREGAERLRAFLAAAYGEAWTGGTMDGLLAEVGYAGKSLEVWLRDGFFEQHCKLFRHYPFIWQIWDGRRDGFSALVNYHGLDGPKLQKLAYTYLGAWLERQRDEKARNVAGADDRLTAAQALQRKLALILEGEPLYDIYVRWKKLHEQAIGWDPDLEDGVRMNIRPFIEAGVLRWKPNIKWGVDRGKNPDGSARENDLHLTIAEKQEARRRAGVRV
jgi:hypothetical protein